MADETKPESPQPAAPDPVTPPVQPESPKQPAAETKPVEAKPAEAAAPPAAPKPAAPKPPAKPAAPKPPAVMESVPWTDELSEAVKKQFGEQIVECSSYRDQKFIVAKPAAGIPLIEFLKLEAGFDYLVDLTAVHWPKRDAEQFDIIYILYSFSRNDRVRVKIRIAESYNPPTACFVHTTANWMEREVFDMFGIKFDGHPDLRRILMPEEWTGYPLRKDYGIIQMDQRWVKENLGIESGQ